MTIENDLDTVVTSVTTRKNKAVSSKAQLTAHVADALSARDHTLIAANDTLAIRDEASGVATLSGATATASVGVTSYADLTALVAQKAVTAVDVFVYDTSLDSDGGAWRKRTQHTSWYNETLNTATRGSRREFPAVAVIVAETNKVTIYDGDDPALPMWMVVDAVSDRFFNTAGGGAVTSIAIKNGWLVGTTSTRGYSRLNFISEEAYIGLGTATYKISAPIAVFRNTLVFPTYTITGSVFSIVNPTVNDVAMTVLPDAPIDPATGLPVPTIAVATNGGVSVIKDDGTVVDSALTTAAKRVTFADGGVVFDASNSTTFRTFSIPTADGFSAIGMNHAGSGVIALACPIGSGAITDLKSGVYANSGGLARVHSNVGAMSTSLLAYTTSTYNTGWMNGDIRGAFLSSTDATSLVGSGELVTNGTFDTDTSGWTANTAFSLSVVSQALNVAYTSGSGGQFYIGATQVVTTTVGKSYTIRFDVTAVSSNLGRVRVEATLGGGQNLNLGSLSVGSYQYTFVATAATTYVNLCVQSDATGSVTYDNISVKLADADRSVNNKGLIVNGTITRSPVASGAELVGYSGFSTSNYLEQSYNSALDFGTGDFCIMGWVRKTGTNNDRLMERSGFNGSIHNGPYLRMTAVNQKLQLIASDTGNSASQVESSNTLLLNQWTYFCFVRVGNTISLYIDGRLDSSFSSGNFDGSFSNSIASLVIGTTYESPGSGAVQTNMALLRISAAAPTADQIKKIYEDEKYLFQPGAKCTLYGTSDAVTALAHDPVTNLLHVGTSAGRSVFDGLVRVDNTTVAVGAAISAVNGFVVEE